jgi:1-aminocyclopropane-1-carboxylate deaminase/D-cysteine desulfhydrase-like pyridoxal-dependent ACC family enzyme
MFGARVHLIAAGPTRSWRSRRRRSAGPAVVEALRAEGERPYVIPVGGSSGVGALGYVAGTRELVEQLEAMALSPTRLYYASGSRGTQAGLELGSRLFSPPYRLFGIAVSGGEEEKGRRAARVATEAAALVGSTIAVSANELVTSQDHWRGLRHSDAGRTRAIRLLAVGDGVLLDPTYTASDGGARRRRAIGRDRSGRDDPVPHTGGVPAVRPVAAAFEPFA